MALCAHAARCLCRSDSQPPSISCACAQEECRRAVWPSCSGRRGVYREARASLVGSHRSARTLLDGGLDLALRPPHAPLPPSTPLAPAALRSAAVLSDPEAKVPPPVWQTRRVGFPAEVSFGGREVPSPLSALAECYNMKCSAHRASIPQARRHFEAAVVAEMDLAFGLTGQNDFKQAGRRHVTAVGAGLVYQEFRLLQLLRDQGISVSRLVLIDPLYSTLSSESPPAADLCDLRSGIFQQYGSWAAVRWAVVLALQQVTDFLASDGVDVFVFDSVANYEQLCDPGSGKSDSWRCDLLVQVDAGEQHDGLSDVSKAIILQPGGLFAVLWAMTAHVAEEDSGAVDIAIKQPLRFTFARLEQRIWARMQSVAANQSCGGARPCSDPRMRVVRQWRTYRTAAIQARHEDFMRELETFERQPNDELDRSCC